jgi:hypothetical protein
MDAADGLWGCPWLGGVKADMPCRIVYEDTKESVFEPFDGTNCTWGSAGSVYRGVPAGYEGRRVLVIEEG